MDDRVRLRSDSAAAKRIVRSFIDFLGAVELVPGVDAESLEVAAECLTQAFGLRGSDEASDERISLLDLLNQKRGPPSASAQEHRTESSSSGISNEGAYGQFIEGLESAGYFSVVPTEHETRLFQAESIFEETLKNFKGKDQSDLLAEAFKAQGNAAMAIHHYVEAVELYTLAISVSSNNAIYFANRAAAHTQAGNASAAIMDCHKAIEINPRYSKAYGRLGLVHYSQGRYAEAAEWFSKALEVDPSNASASENLQSAEKRLHETRSEGAEAGVFEPPSSGAVRLDGNIEVPAAFLDFFEDRQTSNAQQSQQEDQQQQQQQQQQHEQPGFRNFVQMLGGFPQATAAAAAAGAAGGGVNSVAPQEFAIRLQSALQSALGMPGHSANDQAQPH